MPFLLFTYYGFIFILCFLFYGLSSTLPLCNTATALSLSRPLAAHSASMQHQGCRNSVMVPKKHDDIATGMQCTPKSFGVCSMSHSQGGQQQVHLQQLPQLLYDGRSFMRLHKGRQHRQGLPCSYSQPEGRSARYAGAACECLICCCQSEEGMPQLSASLP